MQDAELFMGLAGIAGVFVGFGALIAVRSGGASDAFEIAYVRGIVSQGLLTVVAALAPVTLVRYPLEDHQVWVLSTILVVVLMLASVAMQARTPEWREDTVTAAELGYPRWFAPVAVLVVGLLVVMLVLSLPVILLGVATDLEPALYFTIVVLSLLWDGWLLLQMVFRERRLAGA